MDIYDNGHNPLFDCDGCFDYNYSCDGYFDCGYCYYDCDGYFDYNYSCDDYFDYGCSCYDYFDCGYCDYDCDYDCNYNLGAPCLVALATARPFTMKITHFEGHSAIQTIFEVG